MKIALAMENFSMHSGGAESYAVLLARTLVADGWEVHVYGHSWDGDPREALFHPIPRLPRWMPASVRILHFALAHRKMVRGEDFDVVLGFGNTLEMNVYQSHGGVHRRSTLRKLEAVRNPVARLVKGLFAFLSPKYHARAWIESAPFRKDNRPIIIAISHMVRSDISEHFRIPEDEIRLVYNGIDTRRFGAVSKADDPREIGTDLSLDGRILFLFMAYDYRKKGVRDLVEAAALLRDRVGEGKFGVALVGGPPSPSLERLADRLDLGNLVEFHGPTKQPESYYQACDVFVLPTYYDACSLVVFEAMAAGLPVITTSHNGASGIINHGVNGIVIGKPGNVEELADAMHGYLDRGSLKAASVAARQTAAGYSLEENHRKMIEILREAASLKRYAPWFRKC